MWEQGSAMCVGQPNMKQVTGRWDKVKQSFAGSGVKRDQTDGTILPPRSDNRSGTASPSKLAGSQQGLADVVWAAAVQNNLDLSKNNLDLSKRFGMGCKAAQAQEANLHQANEGDKKGTIWHACKYVHDKDPGKRKEGRDSWEAIQKKLDTKMDSEAFQEVRKRGIFGETTLHAAVLYADILEDGKFDDWLVRELWSRFPELRTAQYGAELYKGENVLHLAIIKSLPRSLIEFFLSGEDSEITEMLNGKATGMCVCVCVCVCVYATGMCACVCFFLDVETTDATRLLTGKATAMCVYVCMCLCVVYIHTHT
jgi:hypothetical protein